MSSDGRPGAFRPGDEPGRRRFATVCRSGLKLEAGGVLDSVTVAYETWGELDAAKSNAVLVAHALTGDSHAAGREGPGHPTPGWWEGLIGPGRPIDSDRYFVVCPNVLGGCRGTTGPSSAAPGGRPFGSRFPLITIRDQVAVEAALADELGVETWACVLGGSMGGMRVLEWCVGYPGRVERAVALAVGAAASAEQIALCSLQIRAIENDAAFLSGDYYAAGAGPVAGLSIARGIGQISYRTERELAQRFGRDAQDGEDPFAGGRYAVESYLAYHGEKLVGRFDANSYLVLSRAMNHHDVGRDRGGAAAALETVRADVTVVGIDTDRLYPVAEQEELLALLPRAGAVRLVHSEVGHDGFLVEVEQVGAIVAEVLDV